jgi:hypothetical protein
MLLSGEISSDCVCDCDFDRHRDRDRDKASKLCGKTALPMYVPR